MKLKRLDLIAFGSLRASTLDLDGEAACLHLVYGPNEAGKSTALRALHGLFFGIPETTADDHSIKASELRVGALLCDAHGRELYVVRRKGRKQTLAAESGQPLEGADVSWITAGVSEAQFGALFALGHDTLDKGAAELLGSAGELGQSLFSAANGGASAHSVLEALREEADALYRPRGKNQLLNEALAAFDAAKRCVRDQAIHAEVFTTQQLAIDEAEAELSRLNAERKRLHVERARLERARRVLPLCARRAELQASRAGLGDVVVLAPDAPEERRRLERAQRDASLLIEHLEQELVGLDQSARGLCVPAALASLDPALMGDLRDQLLQQRRAQRGLPARRERLAFQRQQLATLLGRLGLPAGSAQPAGMRVSRPLEARIREHARAGEALAARIAELTRQLGAKQDELCAQRVALHRLIPPPPRPASARELQPSPAASTLSAPAGLAGARGATAGLAGARGAAPVEPAPARAAGAGRAASAAASAAIPGAQLQRAARRQLQLEQVELELPLVARAHRPRARPESTPVASGPESAAEVAAHVAADAVDDATVAPGQGSAEPVARGSDAKNPHARAAPREAREPAVAGGAQAEPASPARVSLARLDEFERIFSELERDLSLGSERLRDEEQARERVERELEALARAGQPPTEQQLAAARAARTALFGRTREQVLSGATRQAALMLAELERESAAVDVIADRLRHEATRVAEYARLHAAQGASVRQLAQLRSEQVAREEQRVLRLAEWESCCRGAGVPLQPPAQLRGLLHEYRAELARHDQLERECVSLARELASQVERQAAWRAAWAELLSRVQLPPDAVAAEVEALLAGLSDVAAQAEAIAAAEREIDGLERDLARFSAEVTRLVERHLPGEPFASVELAAEQLLERQQAAREAAERGAQLAKQREQRCDALRVARRHEAEAERGLSALMRAARVTDPSQLEEAEQRARRARELDALLAETQRELIAAADGASLAALESELGASSLAQIHAEREELEEVLEALETERERTLHRLESCRAGLARLREGRGAADAALDAELQLENVRALAQRYVRAKLALGVLSRELERYRERHKAPILRSASTLFEQLTGGAFAALDADLADGDKPRLLCVRRDGERVAVPGLSAGTRDQLYLALRLASIEQLAAGRELMPLVMDDVLVHFDDDRARAALRVLGDFARTTQVLLFTHHARLCELAREALPDERLRLHRLAAPLRERELLRPVP